MVPRGIEPRSPVFQAGAYTHSAKAPFVVDKYWLIHIFSSPNCICHNYISLPSVARFLIFFFPTPSRSALFLHLIFQRLYSLASCLIINTTNQNSTASGVEPDTFSCYFPFRKKGSRLCFHHTQPYWLTPGLEPCSSVAQTDALPIMLKPTFVIGNGLEPLPPGSAPGMLPLHHPIFKKLYRRQDSNADAMISMLTFIVSTCSLFIPGEVSGLPKAFGTECSYF